MKRLLQAVALVSVLSLVNLATVVVLLGLAGKGAAQSPPCLAGDVNGDGSLDVTDPIYLLAHIFEGGPEPVACAQEPINNSSSLIVTPTVGVSSGNTPVYAMEGEVSAWPNGPEKTVLPLPRGGMLKNLTVHTSSNSPTGGANVTLLVNGVETNLVATAPSPGGVATNLVDEVPVQAGDLVVFRLDWSGSEAVFLRVALEYQ